MGPADGRVRAVNLFGYGKTPPWPAATTQTLSDQARLVEDALPPDAGEIYLVGHSFGGSVAMKVVARLPARVARLVLLETNPFYLLAQAGRVDAFAEAMELRNYIRKFGALGEWTAAAEKFADYWNGVGTWREMSFDRRAAFSEALKPNFFEWDAVMNDTTPAEQWAALLPNARCWYAILGRFCQSARSRQSCVGPVAVGLTRRCLEPATWPRSRARTWSIRWSPLFWGSPANNQRVIKVGSGQAPNTLKQAWVPN